MTQLDVQGIRQTWEHSRWDGIGLRGPQRLVRGRHSYQSVTVEPQISLFVKIVESFQVGIVSIGLTRLRYLGCFDKSRKFLMCGISKLYLEPGWSLGPRHPKQPLLHVLHSHSPQRYNFLTNIYKFSSKSTDLTLGTTTIVRMTREVV